MTGFDAELYLRLIGERLMVDAELVDPSRVATELVDAAAALVVGGVIDERRAAEISSEYALAGEFVRHPAVVERYSPLRRSLTAGDPPELEARRVFTPDAVLRLAVGELRVATVLLSERRTAIEGTLLVHGGSAVRHSLTLGAPGQSASTHFSGDLHGTRMVGLWECDSSFPPGTGCLDIDGCRLVLGAGQPAPSFTVRTFSAAERLQRFLWLLVSGWGANFGETSVETAVSALRAAGLLAADDDPGTLAVSWSRTSRYGSSGPDAVRVSGPLPSVDVPVSVPAGWPAAVIPRAHPDGTPSGTVGIGAVSPRFDGVMVAVDSLTVDGHGLAAEVEVSGATLRPGRLPGAELGIKPISWWVSDDLGNRYLGELAGSSSLGRHTRGRIRFGDVTGEPARLTITVATAGAAAAMAIPLEWS